MRGSVGLRLAAHDRIPWGMTEGRIACDTTCIGVGDLMSDVEGPIIGTAPMLVKSQVS